MKDFVGLIYGTKRVEAASSGLLAFVYSCRQSNVVVFICRILTHRS